MMDIQSAALNELFVLYPVIIQGWISPVLPAGTADGGIPKSLYDGVLTELECLIDPWTEVQSWTLAVDDRVDLYVNDAATPVHGKTINPGEENLRIRLNVPHGQLQDGVNTLHYIVTRPGGNGAEKSRVLEVLYHLRAPGEPAPAGMRLQIPTAVRDQGVDAEQAAQGVVFGFDYTNRRAYDRIRLTLRPPRVKEAPDGKLDPIAAKDRLTVVVPHYTGMLATDKLSVTWAGTVGGGSQHYRRSVVWLGSVVGRADLHLDERESREAGNAGPGR